MIRTYFGFIQMPIIDTKHASKYLCNETLTWMIDIWMTNHLVSDNNCNIVNMNAQFFSYKEWQIVEDLDIVLVTLHRRLTISIEKDK
jgi:hypothetical protein